MKFKIKESSLTDNSKVYDVELFPNGQQEHTGRQMCIFSCVSQDAADSFVIALEKLISKYTVEDLEEI